MFEELVVKYSREDYGRQFNTTITDAYRKLNPTMKAPRIIDGDTAAWESNSIRFWSHPPEPRNSGRTNPSGYAPITRDG